MAVDKQIQISAAVLEDIVLNAQEVSGFSTPKTDADRAALARLNRALSTAVSLLRGAAGPQSFSGNETGQFRVDPSSSQFL